MSDVKEEPLEAEVVEAMLRLSDAEDTKPAKDARPRWMDEMSRGKSRKDIRRRIVGFGSFYQRPPGKYSEAEFLAEQGHPDRIRTADLTEGHRAEREQADDDSGKESDWQARTAIDPKLFQSRKDMEKEMRDKRKLNKAFVRRNK